MVEPGQIHRIKESSIWTNTSQLSGCTLDSKVSHNRFKKCNVQSVRCVGCRESLGTYYSDPYFDSDTGKKKEGQPFPCFKLTHFMASDEPDEPPR